MTTKNKNSIIRDIVKGTEIRGVTVNKRKYYFVGDLVKTYGSSFLSSLPSPPISMRIADGGNSQTRRLVNVTDFKNTIRSKKASVKPSALKLRTSSSPACKKIIARQMELPLSEKPVKPIGNVSKLPLVEIKDPVVNDITTARANMLKSDIKHWCKKFSDAQVKKLKLTASDLEKTDRSVYRETYYTMYQEFDRVLSVALKVSVYGLADFGFGKTFRKAGMNYLDVVEKNGMLELLHTVARSLFSSK